MKVLILTPRLPYPPYRGDKLKIWNLIKHLSRNHEITLLSFIQIRNEQAYLDHLRQFCNEVHVVHLPFWRSLLNCVAGAACVLYPTTFEVFGLPVVESMHCGTPVIASRVGSIPEVAGDGALLVDPENDHYVLSAVGTVLNDAEFRSDLTKKGNHRSSFFSWSKTARGMLDVYESVYRDHMSRGRDRAAKTG